MILPLLLAGSLTPGSRATAPEEATVDARLAKLRNAYANVRSAAVHSTFRKVWESEESPAVEVNTVTYFERPNRIYIQATRPGVALPFLSYVTDGRTFRRTENGVVTKGPFDANDSLPGMGVTLETLALWQGETLLRPGSRLLPHRLTTNTISATGLDGRSDWTVLMMREDEIAIFIDPRTGLIGLIEIGWAAHRSTGAAVPRYSFRVNRWELGKRFPRKFFEIPGEPGADASGGKDGSSARSAGGSRD